MKIKEKFALLCVSIAVMLTSYPVPASCDNFFKNFDAKKILEIGQSLLKSQFGLPSGLSDLATSELFSRSNNADNETFSNVKEIIEAAKDGDEEAQYKLGRMYEEGKAKGITKDYYDAARWYGRSASQGYAKAQHRLGLLFMKGHGVIQNKSRGLSLITQAAQQGYVTAQLELGKIYYESRDKTIDINGIHETLSAQNRDKAFYLISQASQQDFDDDESSKNKRSALYWLEKASEKDFNDAVKAQLILGTMYYKGEVPGGKKDYYEARKYLMKAAAKGDKDAQYLMGSIYLFLLVLYFSHLAYTLVYL